MWLAFSARARLITAIDVFAEAVDNAARGDEYNTCDEEWRRDAAALDAAREKLDFLIRRRNVKGCGCFVLGIIIGWVLFGLVHFAPHIR
jgi:hypothetical protein